jgi:hypothetical protein
VKKPLILAAACLVASFTQAQPLQPDLLRLRVTMQLAADLGVPRSVKTVMRPRGSVISAARPDGRGCAPRLTITLTATNSVLISWPSPSIGWTLNQNANLNTVNWSEVLTTPVDSENSVDDQRG